MPDNQNAYLPDNQKAYLHKSKRYLKQGHVCIHDLQSAALSIRGLPLQRLAW